MLDETDGRQYANTPGSVICTLMLFGTIGPNSSYNGTAQYRIPPTMNRRVPAYSALKSIML